MKPSFVVVLLCSILAAPAIARAEESGSFVMRLGQDTTSVEYFTRSATRTEVNQVGRAPRVLRRHFIYDYVDGAITHLSLVVVSPASTTPTQTVDATFGPDSMRMQIHNGAAPVQNVTMALPKDVLVLASSSPWSGYERALSSFARSKSMSMSGKLYLIGLPALYGYEIKRIGGDSVEISNDHLDVYHVRIDREGRVLGVVPIAGTGQFSAERAPKLDLEALSASFFAREQSGAGMGALSPRDTLSVANAGSASLWFDYGRPGKRGRDVFGHIVPFGQVWRTGANAATQFRTDKALDFGGTVVPAGFYTLWTIPSADGWKLIVNSETGQWGTDHKAEKDLLTIAMKTSVLPQVVERFTIGVEPSADGGVLTFDWDATRASASFKVVP